MKRVRSRLPQGVASARRLFHIAISFVYFGCAKAENRSGDSAASAGTAAHKFRVALLTPGPISDQSWNGGAYAGLLRIRDSLGADISHIETKSPAEFAENFRQYGSQGYDLVFGHGFEFQDAAVRVAPEYPKTVYVTTSGNRVANNVAGMNFAFEDASYLAGLVAGSTTKTNKLGCIGGTELPPVKASFAAFEAGAKAINPRVTVAVSYVGNWDDPSAGREQALAQIGRGIDVIFQNADAAGLGVFQAAREKKISVIGSNSNQNAVAPEVTLGSVVIDLPRALTTVARDVRDRKFTPHVYDFGEKDKVVTWVPNPKAAPVTPALQQKLDSMTREMDAGRFHLGATATP